MTSEIGMTSTSVRGVGGGGGLGPVLPTQDNIATWQDSTTLKDSGVPISRVGITRENYAYIYDTTVQPILAVNTFQPVTFNTNSVLNGWTHTAGTSQIVCPIDGVYEIEVVVVFQKTAGGFASIDAIFSINGMEAIGSQVGVGVLVNFARLTFGRTRPLALLANDILELCISSNSTNIQTDVPLSPGGATQIGTSINIMRIA